MTPAIYASVSFDHSRSPNRFWKPSPAQGLWQGLPGAGKHRGSSTRLRGGPGGCSHQQLGRSWGGAAPRPHPAMSRTAQEEPGVGNSWAPCAERTLLTWEGSKAPSRCQDGWFSSCSRSRTGTRSTCQLVSPLQWVGPITVPPHYQPETQLHSAALFPTSEASVVSWESLASSQKSCFCRQAGGLKVKCRTEKWRG